RAYVFALAANLHCAGHAHGRANTSVHDLQAWDHFEKARCLLDDLIRSDKTVPDYRHELGRLYKSMAVLERERKRPGDARTFCERAVALQQPLADKFPAVLKYRFELAGHLTLLGQLLVRDRPEEADRIYQRALQERRQLVHDAPWRAVYHAD